MKPPLKEHDMDVIRNLFGIRFVPGGAPEGCFELYIEDDENYHYKLTANNVWLDDLIATAKAAKEKVHK